MVEAELPPQVCSRGRIGRLRTGSFLTYNDLPMIELEEVMTARILIILSFALALTDYLGAQQPLVVPAKQEVTLTVKADSTQVQLAYEKQKNLQLQSQILNEQYQKQVSDLQKQFGGYEATIQSWIAQTKKANGFGDDVQYDRDQDKWFKAEKQKSASKAVKPAAK